MAQDSSNFEKTNTALRKQAEQLLLKKRKKDRPDPSTDSEQLMQDLQIHQIELEMQNEALRQSTLELEEVHRRYVELYNQAPIGYVSLDHTGLILIANATLAHMLGVDPIDLKGKPLVEFMDPQDQVVFRSRFKAILRQPENKHLDVTFVRQAPHDEGPTFVGRLIARRVDERQHQQGQIAAGAESLNLSISDITELNRAENERQRIERSLQQARKLDAIGQLAGGVAHEFNNLLAIMLGNVNLMQMRLTETDRGRFDRYLDQITQAGNRATTMVRQMLAYSHPEANHAAPLSIDSTAQELIDWLRSTLPASMSIHFEAYADLPDVSLDRKHLQQLLTNLLINARDATHGKGNVQVALHPYREKYRECLKCHQLIQGDWVELSVKDDGCGIPPENISKILDPFFTTKETGKGTGLGLSVVQGIMESSGGHLLVDSKPGGGSCFRLLFPPSPEPPAINRPATDVPTATPRQSVRVLLVDDEPGLVDLLQEWLEAWGMSVTSTTDSLEAKSLLLDQARHFDLLVTDQTMPGLLGTELTAIAKAKRLAIKVVLCTGYSEQLDASACRELGIDHYLLKPIEPEELKRLIEELLQRDLDKPMAAP